MAAAVASTSTSAPSVSSKQDVIVPLWAKMIAGAIAGVIGTSLIFPLDLVKTRLQSGSGGYTGPVTAFRSIVASEGVVGLYAGLKPNLLGVAPEKALKLSVNDGLREAFTARNGDGRIRLWQEMASGATAGFLQVAVTNPMEIVKLRMQLEALKPSTPGSTRMSAGATVSSLGVRGLYTGATACWARDVPFSLVFFPLFANLKAAAADSKGETSLPALFASGAIAGSLSAAVVTPCDVVKTRLQVEGGSVKYKGVLHAFRSIAVEEGLRAFSKGLIPRMIVQAPLFGCTLLSYEILKAMYRT